MLASLVVALVLGAAPAQTTAVVRVTVANVWASPGAGHLPLDSHLWPTSAITYSQRLALVGQMPTQVLYGERVRVLDRRGGWTHVAVPDQPSPLDARGYPGWVLSWQLGAPLAPRPSTVTVSVRSATLANGSEVSFGTQLPLLSRRDASVTVETPSGASRLPANAVAALPRTPADVVRSARQFVGLHYLWGGLSAWGYDCSGLTWAAYRAHGITIPRDADAQFTAGRAVPLARVRPGDLLFYESPVVGHVAMAIGAGLMIEAPNSASEVRIVPLRTSDFRGARRFFRRVLTRLRAPTACHQPSRLARCASNSTPRRRSR